MCLSNFTSTKTYWEEFVRNIAVPVEYQSAVIRAGITLALNTYEETGAIISATTSSIPYSPQAVAKHDYRCASWRRYGIRALTGGPLQLLLAPRFASDRVDSRLARVCARSGSVSPSKIGAERPLGSATSTMEHFLRYLANIVANVIDDPTNLQPVYGIALETRLHVRGAERGHEQGQSPSR